VFSSNYDNYKIVFKATKSTSSEIFIRLRVGGVDADSSLYGNARINLSDQVITGNAANDSGFGLAIADTQSQFSDMTIFSPFLVETTGLISSSHSGGLATAGRTRLLFSRHGGNTSFDGFSLIASTGTMSGLIQVYGFRKG
jgi:hypothetical protein